MVKLSTGEAHCSTEAKQSQRQDKRGRGGSSPSQWRGERAVLAVACVVTLARECRAGQQSTALHFNEHAAGMVHTSASARASACLTLALLPAESVASSLISLISLMTMFEFVLRKM